MMNLLDQIALENNIPIDSPELAHVLDKQDPLAKYRSYFEIPIMENPLNPNGDDNKETKQVVYMCGHSMGLQPKSVRPNLDIVLKQWAQLGVQAYHHGPMPASHCDLEISRQCADLIVGAQPDEVSLTANLSVNMHFLMAAFYRPHGEKNCILIEEEIFPSDYYVIESQLSWHGLTTKECIITLRPRPGEFCLRTEDIITTIQSNANRLALIWLSGVNYVTGQLYDMQKVTEAGHNYAKCFVGWDLAHAVGNVPLELHDWNIDIAVWCSYKYLNGSPGALGGLFIHLRHHHTNMDYDQCNSAQNPDRKGPQLTGWWSHRNETRFQMTRKMELEPGAAAFRISNPPLLLAAALKASLDIFSECGGLQPIHQKSQLLFAYAITLITQGRYRLSQDRFILVTPSNSDEHGAQITLYVTDKLNELYEGLMNSGYYCDIRGNHFLRFAPIPLYNSFMDVYLFVKRMYELSR